MTITFQLTQLYMTHSSPLTWVEWLDSEMFLTSDSGGSVHLHKWDLGKLTKKIHQGTYEDKEEPRRKFDDHAPFGVYQVKLVYNRALECKTQSVTGTSETWIK